MDTVELQKLTKRVFELVGVKTLDQYHMGRERLTMAIEDTLRDRFSLVAFGADKLVRPIIDCELMQRLTTKEVVARVLAHLLQDRRIWAVHNDPKKTKLFVDRSSIKKFFSNSYAATTAGHCRTH